MTQKFNVGDTVRCVDARSVTGLKQGHEYVVGYVQGDRVRIDGTGYYFAGRFERVRPAEKMQYVLVYPNGVMDAQRFDTEDEAAEAGEEAFDAFEVHSIKLVAKYTVETTSTLLRKAA